MTGPKHVCRGGLRGVEAGKWAAAASTDRQPGSDPPPRMPLFKLTFVLVQVKPIVEGDAMRSCISHFWNGVISHAGRYSAHTR